MRSRILAASAAAIGLMIIGGGCGGGGEGDQGGGGGAAGVGGAGHGGASASGQTTTSNSAASAGSAEASAASSGAGGAAVNCTYPKGYPDASVTFYTFDMGSSAVNCSFDILGKNPDKVAHVPFGGGQYFGAMNTADYNAAATCGACVHVERDNGKSVDVMIVDQCPVNGNPVCKTGHIDLSKQAFLQIGTEQEGYLGTTNGGAKGKISWKYVPCPDGEDISFRLKDPSNQYWNQILVEGHRHPITKLEVEIKGVWQAATRQTYNYWQVGAGDLGAAPYHVRVTDVNGQTVEAMLKLQAGDQPSGVQFPVCK